MPVYRRAVRIVIRSLGAVGVILLLGSCAIMELTQLPGGALGLFDDTPETIHVAPWGSDTDPGTKALPVRTIQYAFSLIPTREESVEVRIAAGEYAPGAGLISEGQHGVMYRADYHRPDTDRGWPSVTVSFGWNRLFDTTNPAAGGGTTRLRGYGSYDGGDAAVVLAFYDDDGTQVDTANNLERGYGDPETTVFTAAVLGDLSLTVTGSLEVEP